jgi:serine/threonine protein kinase
VLEKLGEGAHATVYVARSEGAATDADHQQWPEVQLGQGRVALKVAKLLPAGNSQRLVLPAVPQESVDAVFRSNNSEAAGMSEIRRLFYKEFFCLDQARQAQANHVVQLHGAGAAEIPGAMGGPLYVPVLLLELATGGTAIDVVCQRIATSVPGLGVAVEEAAGLILDACKGLVEIHQLNIIHRDVKVGEIQGVKGKPDLSHGTCTMICSSSTTAKSVRRLLDVAVFAVELPSLPLALRLENLLLRL